MKIEEVIELKEEIETSKTEKAQLEGEMKAILKQLQEEWGCPTIEQATKKYKEIENEIEKLDKEINNDLNELSQKLEEYQ